ncbi:WD repeat-containing protein 78 isoform X1 [Cryptotermes secundus]|uniref:WD repeat-containing protein 78 isoform X1 n=1 Tax=Cryptotermes secundus TaxID=105785 RepID=UPI000CD7D0A6|nr:WD repeat-containing protein 78 isoform X1 [Cryptotermes secundus]
MDLIKKRKMANTSTRSKSNKPTFVSEWDMYDIHNDMEERTGKEMQFMKKEVSDESKESSKIKFIAKSSPYEGVNITPKEQFESVAKSEAFLDACARMERLLGSNTYRDQQKAFRGLRQPDPFRLDVQFRYRLELLWSFTSDYVRGRTVTGMCWNSLNTDLLAVGYGKYFYKDRKNGLVCCWTIKNPTQPERKYKFDSPVTSVNFSTDRPNLLACGFHNGSIVILDISARNKTVIALSNRETSPSYEPVWQIFWFREEEYQRKEEQIMTCCQDGRIWKYRREETLSCLPMMLVTRMEGTMKGIDQPRKSRAHDIPVSRHPAALVLTRHPVDTLTYFVDWCVRIWTEDVVQPLLTLNTSMESVQGAAWSPVSATIIASISANDIHLWDIKHKIFVPASTATSPTDTGNLMIQFTASGLNLVIGDGEGAVHVYGLQDMPFSPFYQEIALIQAIKKALVTRPELLKILKKIGKPFY